MRKILLMVDNSNVHISTMKNFGSRARFSYTNFERLYIKDKFISKQIICSTPPRLDGFWDKMKKSGYKVITYERIQTYDGRTEEKGVDTGIVARGTELIINEKPDILLLLSGDLDMKPLVRMAKKYSCDTVLWTYKESVSPDLENECDETFFIDDYAEELIFFRDPIYGTESFTVREKRLERERKNMEAKYNYPHNGKNNINNVAKPPHKAKHTAKKILLTIGMIVAAGFIGAGVHKYMQAKRLT